MTLTKKQLEDRRKGITGTDVAAILGLNPWKKPIDVQMDKLGKSQAIPTNARMLIGQHLEPTMREDYAERHGVYVAEPGTVTHSEHDWARGTPDGIAYPKNNQRASHRLTDAGRVVHYTEELEAIEGVEFKVVGERSARFWGEPGTDEVPAYVHVQCDWYMFITGIDRWRVVAKMDLEDYEYVIERDKKLEATMVEQAREFWERHVLAEEPIPPDGSKSFTKFVANRFPVEQLQYIRANSGQLAVIQALYEMKQRLGRLEEEKEQLIQSLKLEIGEHAGIEFPSISKVKAPVQRITWKRSKDSPRTNWQQVANALAQILLQRAESNELAEQTLKKEIEAIRAAATTTVQGTRRFTTPRSW